MTPYPDGVSHLVVCPECKKLSQRQFSAAELQELAAGKVVKVGCFFCNHSWNLSKLEKETFPNDVAVR